MTRTLKISAIALLGALVLWACGGGAKTSKDVGTAFLEALAEGDFSTAKDYATKDSQEALDMMETMGGGETTGSKDDIKVGEVKEDGDKATLMYTEKGEEKTLDMVKEDGEWKVKYSKGGPTEGNSGLEELDNAMEDLGNAMEEAMEEVGGEE